MLRYFLASIGLSLLLLAGNPMGFFDVYGKNRIEGKGNLITAEFISFAYANYKLTQENHVEQKILKPRVLNFSGYLYQGIVQIEMPHKERVLAYSAILSILASKDGQIEIPDGYDNLKNMIISEAKLVMEAKEKTLSPILNVEVDYKKFSVPPRYQDDAAYYRTLKYAQTIPLSVVTENNETIGTQIDYTIKASQRLTNLYNALYKTLGQLESIDHKNDHFTFLFPSTNLLDEMIFIKNKNRSIEKMIKILDSSEGWVQKVLLNLDSSYAYDMKIIKRLWEAGHEDAAKGYYALMKTHNHALIYEHITPTPGKKRKKADIDDKLISTLDVMIESIFIFAQTRQLNSKDLAMVQILKRLRTIAQKKDARITLDTQEIEYLNSVDLTLLDLLEKNNTQDPTDNFLAKKIQKSSLSGAVYFKNNNE